MITVILIKKIVSLFLIMFLGALLVKTKLVKAEDSRVLSTICLYLIVPCTILNAFEVELSEEIVSGFLLALAAAILIHIFLLVIFIPLDKILKLDVVEKLSMMYSNAGNLIIPLVMSILGPEWIIYSTAYMSVQLFFLWSHAKSAIQGVKGFDLKRILFNVNLISVFLGIIIFITGFRFPGPIQDAMDSIGGMIGPLSMLVTGMLIGSKDLKSVIHYKRVWLVAFIRLIGIPLIILFVLKYSGAANLVENGQRILMITLLATLSPAASTITQMSVVYEKDADYASAINVITTLCCIITMPLMIMLYQL